MLRKPVFLALAAALVMLLTSSRAGTWSFHVGYTHYGAGGVSHVGRTAYGGYGRSTTTAVPTAPATAAAPVPATAAPTAPATAERPEAATTTTTPMAPTAAIAAIAKQLHAMGKVASRERERPEFFCPPVAHAPGSPLSPLREI